MYGQMTAGSWIYIGTQGILQGTYETLAECAHQQFGGSLAGHDHADGRARRHGRRAAARRHDERRRGALRRRRPRADRATDQDALPRPRDRRPGRRPRLGRRRRGPRARPCRSGCSATAPRSCPSCSARVRRPTSSPTRRARTTRWADTCPAGLSLRRGGWRSRRDPEDYVRPRLRVDGRTTSTRWWASLEAGSVVFDYGNNLRAGRGAGGLAHDRAYSYPGFVPAFVRPLFCEGKGPFRWAALVGRPGRHRGDGPRRGRTLPRRRSPAAVARHGAAERVAFQGLPRTDLLARLRRARSRRRALQRDGRVGRGVGPDRDRTRPPGHRQRRVPVPRDRGDARRLRRDRRLAHPQRA